MRPSLCSSVVREERGMSDPTARKPLASSPLVRAPLLGRPPAPLPAERRPRRIVQPKPGKWVPCGSPRSAGWTGREHPVIVGYFEDGPNLVWP